MKLFNLSTSREQVLAGLMLVGALAILLAVYKVVSIQRAIAQHANFTPPPEAVTSIIATETEWTSTLTAVGSVSPVQGVTLAVEEGGTVRGIFVESGAEVTKGTVLVELDTSVEEAELKAKLAMLDRARQELDRVRSLKDKNAISRSEFDRVESEFRSTDAEAAAIKAHIARKRAIAPFDGRVGIRQVNVGQYVAAGTPVIPLYSLDPLYVNFTLPQREIEHVAAGQKVIVTIEGDATKQLEGVVTAINPQVDERTRNVSLQATVKNEDHSLRPGMFVRVILELPLKNRVIAIPNSSISYAPYGDTVFIIGSMKDPKGTEYRGVRSQFVKVGEQRGEQVAILHGITPGEEVVTSGVFKLRPGAAVAVNNSLAPSNNPAPTASDR